MSNNFRRPKDRKLRNSILVAVIFRGLNHKWWWCSAQNV